MICAGAGFATARDAARAGEETARAALAASGRPRFDAALLFASPHYGPDVTELLDAATSVLGTPAVVGASAHGVLAGGRELEGVPAVSVLGFAGVEAQALLLPDLRHESATAGDEIAARLGGPPSERDLVVVLADPGAFDPGPLLDGLRAELGPARVVGAGAFGAGAQPPLSWCGREAATGALAALVLRAGAPPRIGVTQACRPATELLRVTRCEGSWLQELSGRPALDVFREVARGPLADDLRRAASFVFVAVPVDAERSLRPGTYLVRNVAGFDEGSGSLAVAHPLRLGDRIALAVREPSGARSDLKEMLAGLAGPRPAAALYLNCCARGSSLFGMAGLEAAYLGSALGDVPVAGMLGACELGPIGGRSDGVVELLTYTGVLALLDA